MLFRRNIGTTTLGCRRMPLLEELFEPLVLKNSCMSHDNITLLKNYVPPALSHQLEASLSHEFGRHIIKTDWNTFKDPIMESQHEQAARLLHYTLSIVRTASVYPTKIPPKDIGVKSQQWLMAECDLLLEELCMGNVKRWIEPINLIGKKWAELNESQKDALLPSISLISKNPYMHPLIKKRVLKHITQVIINTIQ